jgi:hypothetical protein
LSLRTKCALLSCFAIVARPDPTFLERASILSRTRELFSSLLKYKGEIAVGSLRLFCLCEPLYSFALDSVTRTGSSPPSFSIASDQSNYLFSIRHPREFRRLVDTYRRLPSFPLAPAFSFLPTSNLRELVSTTPAITISIIRYIFPNFCDP